MFEPPPHPVSPTQATPAKLKALMYYHLLQLLLHQPKTRKTSSTEVLEASVYNGHTHTFVLRRWYVVMVKRTWQPCACVFVPRRAARGVMDAALVCFSSGCCVSLGGSWLLRLRAWEQPLCLPSALLYSLPISSEEAACRGAVQRQYTAGSLVLLYGACPAPIVLLVLEVEETSTGNAFIHLVLTP